MLCLKCSPLFLPPRFHSAGFSSTKSVVVCAAKGPRPRYPRVWKTRKRIGTISKAAKLVARIKGLSNVKEEVYGALDTFIAWDLEFPLVTVKKALKTLEDEQDWKRIIQVTKWMLSKGQGRTMGTYFTLLNALAEDNRLEEAEELWIKIFSDNLEGTPRIFFNKMIAIYYRRRMHDKMFEVFADMEELGVKPNGAIITMMGKVFRKLGMMDKYEKLMRKYPPPEWEYRYIRGKRVRVRVKHQSELREDGNSTVSDGESNQIKDRFGGQAEAFSDEESDDLSEEAEVAVDSDRESDEIENGFSNEAGSFGDLREEAETGLVERMGGASSHAS